MGLSDQEIIEWAHSRSTAKNIAAELATGIRSGRLNRWDDLPGNGELAEKWGTGTRTVSRAKRMLSDKGLVRIVGNRYSIE